MAQLARAFANEWAAHGISVNAVAPGYVETDNTAALRDDPERTRQLLERVPAGRWATPEDVAGPRAVPVLGRGRLRPRRRAARRWRLAGSLRMSHQVHPDATLAWSRFPVSHRSF